jgi:hypothetical protein
MHIAFGKKVRVLRGASQHITTPFRHDSQFFTTCKERQNALRKTDEAETH